MRTILPVILAVVILVIVLGYSGVAHALVFFVMLGAVPGTSLTIPPAIMFGVILVIIWLCLFVISEAAYRRQA